MDITKAKQQLEDGGITVDRVSLTTVPDHTSPVVATPVQSFSSSKIDTPLFKLVPYTPEVDGGLAFSSKRPSNLMVQSPVAKQVGSDGKSIDSSNILNRPSSASRISDYSVSEHAYNHNLASAAKVPVKLADSALSMQHRGSNTVPRSIAVDDSGIPPLNLNFVRDRTASVASTQPDISRQSANSTPALTHDSNSEVRTIQSNLPKSVLSAYRTEDAVESSALKPQISSHRADGTTESFPKPVFSAHQESNAIEGDLSKSLFSGHRTDVASESSLSKPVFSAQNTKDGADGSLPTPVLSTHRTENGDAVQHVEINEIESIVRAQKDFISEPSDISEEIEDSPIANLGDDNHRVASTTGRLRDIDVLEDAGRQVTGSAGSHVSEDVGSHISKQSVRSSHTSLNQSIVLDDGKPGAATAKSPQPIKSKRNIARILQVQCA